MKFLWMIIPEEDEITPFTAHTLLGKKIKIKEGSYYYSDLFRDCFGIVTAIHQNNQILPATGFSAPVVIKGDITLDIEYAKTTIVTIDLNMFKENCKIVE
ncbi:MAG: hypothetical protein M0R03_17160 [Novosphingobium sp.]|nr:hypothetical protein [Novosphingobium sp.]